MNYQTRKRLMLSDLELPEATAATAGIHVGKTGAARRDDGPREFRLQELTMLSLGPILRGIQRWWFERAERHYLICADVEEQRAREAQMNVAYYQKRAAMARSARLV